VSNGSSKPRKSLHTHSGRERSGRKTARILGVGCSVPQPANRTGHLRLLRDEHPKASGRKLHGPGAMAEIPENAVCSHSSATAWHVLEPRRRVPEQRPRILCADTRGCERHRVWQVEADLRYGSTRGRCFLPSGRRRAASCTNLHDQLDVRGNGTDGDFCQRSAQPRRKRDA
jgi:hypothetical protein